VTSTAKAPDLPPGHNLAINHAWTWAKAAMVQATRLQNGAGIWDALLLLVALRQVLRAAEMAQNSPLQERRARQILNSAVDRFKKDLPDLVDARDIIEHFDEYAVGKGCLQLKEKAAEPSLTEAELARRYEPRIEGAWSEPIVWVGTRSIEVSRVVDAVDRLFRRMFAAAKTEDDRGPAHAVDPSATPIRPQCSAPLARQAKAASRGQRP
jgi:hypothetical protein